MTDSHAHFTISPLDLQIENEIINFTNKGGKYILNASYDIESMYAVVAQAQKMSKKVPGVLLTAIGIHPEEFIKTKDHDDAKRIIDRYEAFFIENVKNISFVGETGLDYYSMFRDEPTDKTIDTSMVMELQKISFSRHIELAVKHDLPLTIHARELQDQNKCVTDTLKIICDHGNGKVRASMHSYTGDIKAVGDILDLGMYIGFNAIITYKSGENVRDIVKKVPLERILLETDAPLLTLRNAGAKYGAPVDIYEVAKVIAEVKGVDLEKVLAITDENFEKLMLQK